MMELESEFSFLLGCSMGYSNLLQLIFLTVFLFFVHWPDSAFSQDQTFLAFQDSIERGQRINISYNRKSASEFMEEFLQNTSNSFKDRKMAFRYWTELTHFGKRHEELLKKGPFYLILFQSDPDYDAMQAEMSYFSYYSEAYLKKIQDLEKLKKITNRLGNFSQSRRVYALALDRLGRTFFDFNFYDSGLEALQKSNSLFQEMGYKLVASSNLTVQGVLLDAKEDFVGSAKAYEASNLLLGELEQKPYGTISANAYNLGLLYLDRLGDPFKALPFFDIALENDLLDGGETNFYLGDDYKMLSLSALKMGDLSLAESYARRSVEHFKVINQTESSQMATAKLQLALVLHQRKKPELSVEIVNEALTIIDQVVANQRSDLRRAKAQSYNQLGFHLVEIGKLEEAETAYLMAIGIAEELGRDIFRIEALRGLIRLQLLNQKPEKALEYWRKNDQILFSKFREATTLLIEQRLNYLKISKANGSLEAKDLIYPLDLLIKELKQLKAGQELLIEALQFKTEALLDIGSDYSSAYSHLSSVLIQVHKIQQDKIGLINSIAVNTSIRPLIEKSLLLAWNTIQANQNSVAKLNLTELSFQLMEIQKRVIFELGKRLNDESDLENENPKSNPRLALSQVRIKISGIQLGMGDSKSTLHQLYAEEDSLEFLLRKSESGFPKNQVSKPNFISSARFRRPLSDQSLIASYFVGETNIFVWKGDQSNQSLTLLENSSEKIAQLYEWAHGIHDAKSWNKLPKLNLSQWLPDFPPQINSITVIPDGPMCQVPMEIFRVEGGNYLLDKTNVRYLPSLNSLIESKGKPKKNAEWKGFAPAYSVLELPGNQQEVNALKTMTGGLAFLDEEASKSNFLNQAPSADLIHLAVHGELDPVSPNFSRLWFGDDVSDALTAMEINELPLNAGMAVLSACNSGVGDAKFGNGLLSLAQAFRTAGTKSTLMSLWEVPDQETRQLMEAFYGYLQRGLEKDQALRMAKLDYLSSTQDPALRHPFFWAGFVLLGDTEPAYSNGLVWLWAGLLMLGLSLVFVLWRKFRPQSS